MREETKRTLLSELCKNFLLTLWKNYDLCYSTPSEHEARGPPRVCRDGPPFHTSTGGKRSETVDGRVNVQRTKGVFLLSVVLGGPPLSVWYHPLSNPVGGVKPNFLKEERDTGWGGRGRYQVEHRSIAPSTSLGVHSARSVASSTEFSVDYGRRGEMCRDRVQTFRSGRVDWLVPGEAEVFGEEFPTD